MFVIHPLKNMTSFDHFKKQARTLSNIQIQVNPTDLFSPLKEYFQNYPISTWIDLYKFIYQGTCGWSHLIYNIANRTHKNLIQELSAIEIIPNDPTPLLELLDKKTQFARLHLRPWKKKYQNQYDLILESMKKVLIQTPQNITLFRSRIQSIARLVKQDILMIDESGDKRVLSWLNLLLKSTKDTDPVSILPLFHHTTMFRDKYNPSYRIVYYPDFY